MPAPKILLYFTPDTEEIGRIPLSDIKFDTSKKKDRGRYEISLNTPDFIEGNCVSFKSSIKSTATLTFKDKCFGERSKYVFKTNDYFEIWNSADEDDEWCYFRGVIKQTSSNEQGMQKGFTMNLENAGGWILGDNAIYYLSQLIIAKGQSPSNFFNPIKSRYGWIDAGGRPTSKGEALGIDKIKSPLDLLETLIDGFGNARVSILKEDFYGADESIKSIGYYVGQALRSNRLFVSNKLAEMEGSILEILSKFEGRPFSEIFIIERQNKSEVVWRNSRWRDYEEKLCMGIKSGEIEKLITLYSDPNTVIYKDRLINDPIDGQITERQYAGILSEPINKTTDDVVNAFFVFPDMFDSRRNVQTAVLAQTAYDQFQAKQILNLDSIIRHGYKPVNLELPFVPDYMVQDDYDNSAAISRKAVDESQTAAIGALMTEYTGYASKMYKDIQNSGNGVCMFQNNLHCTVADDFRIIRSKSEENLYVNVNKITWNFDASAPTTVIEWDRGWEKNKYTGFTSEEFAFG